MFNNAEIGKRIEELRARKEWTQQDLSDRMELPRTAISQIEQGKRNVTAVELYKFSKELEFPVSDFFSEQTADKEEPINFTKTKKENVQKRISIPAEKLNYEKFKNVLLYILEKCAGKPNVGETVLYKLLYFADFNYFEKHEKFLTGAHYRKLPYGPVPFHLDKIFEKMIKENYLQKIKTEYFSFPQTRYLPLSKADLEELNGAEKETIDKVVEQYSDWSASAISEYSHKDIPWKATSEGEIIDYEFAFYREAPYSAKNYDYEELESSDI